MWVLFAFASAFFAGITSILVKAGIKNTDSDLATALRTIVVLAFSWLMVFIVGSGGGFWSVSGPNFVFLVLSGCATGASWLFYFKALQIGDVNKVAPVDKSSTILTMLLSFVVLGEPISGIMVVGMVGIGFGTYLMIEKKGGIQPGQSDGKWFFYAVLSVVFASLTTILAKIGIKDVESNLAVAIRTTVVLAMAWLIVFVRGKQKFMKAIDLKSWLFLGFSGITTGLSWLFFYGALQDGLASVVVPIDKLSILVSVFFAHILFKEKLSSKALIGLGLLVGGTLTLLLRFS